MKINGSLRFSAALLASLALAATPADAKPGKGNSGDKGKEEGGPSQSQKAKGKGPAQAGKTAGKSGKIDKGPKMDKGPKIDKGPKVDKIDRNTDGPQFARFKDNERNEIVDYFGRFRTQGEGLPPGLAMNQQRGKPLPPGWQKKLVPGYRIDEDEWSRYSLVPSEWFPNLRMEPNTRLYHYGDRVVRVYEPRREVIDVILLPFDR